MVDLESSIGILSCWYIKLTGGVETWTILALCRFSGHLCNILGFLQPLRSIGGPFCSWLLFGCSNAKFTMVVAASLGRR